MGEGADRACSPLLGSYQEPGIATCITAPLAADDPCCRAADPVIVCRRCRSFPTLRGSQRMCRSPRGRRGSAGTARGCRRCSSRSPAGSASRTAAFHAVRRPADAPRRSARQRQQPMQASERAWAIPFRVLRLPTKCSRDCSACDVATHGRERKSSAGTLGVRLEGGLLRRLAAQDAVPPGADARHELVVAFDHVDRLA
jgi:hypothetical protein